MSRVLAALTGRSIEFGYVLTGQHQDYDMSLRFIEELKLPAPIAKFALTSSKPASQIGEMMGKLEPIIDNSGILLIQGDTNSMLAAALTGVKLGIPLAHVEAGLRSFDWRMPEEHNRRMVDHVSDLLFAPTEKSKSNLLNESVYGTVFVTGNTVIDAVEHYLPLALKRSDIMNEVKFSAYCFTTFHRKETVDSPVILREIVETLVEMSFPVVFPVHPRTNLRLHESDLYERLATSPHVCLLPPIGYLDTLVLMKRCDFVLTDSGGLQEEATVPTIRKPVALLRTSTERPEAVDAGFTKIVGVRKRDILESIASLLDNPPSLPTSSPFGDGKAAARIVDIVLKYLG